MSIPEETESLELPAGTCPLPYVQIGMELRDLRPHAGPHRRAVTYLVEDIYEEVSDLDREPYTVVALREVASSARLVVTSGEARSMTLVRAFDPSAECAMCTSPPPHQDCDGELLCPTCAHEWQRDTDDAQGDLEDRLDRALRGVA